MAVSTLSDIGRVFVAVDSFGRKTIEKVKKKRVHIVAAYYYIGVWQALEPLITLFGFPEKTIYFIRNFGIAFFPMVLVFTWFHGEPGRQRFSKREGISYIPTLFVTGLLFMQLSKLPVPNYTVMAPFSEAEKKWYEEHIFRGFEKEYPVRVTLDSTVGEYGREILGKLSSPDSLVLLVRVPLHLTGVLLNEAPNLFLSFDEIAAAYDDIGLKKFGHLVDEYDPLGVQWGRRHGGKLYYLPAEFQTDVMVYSKSKVMDVCENWRDIRGDAAHSMEKLCGWVWPQEHVFEPDPRLWDCYDVFAVAWYWAHQTYGNLRIPRVAYPCCQSELLFTLIDKSLQFGLQLGSIFGVPASVGVSPGEAMVNMFTWEAMFREAGLYYDGMWRGHGLWGREIVEAFKGDEIFLAFLNNRDAARLLDYEDARYAPLPESPEGKRTGFSTLWFWAVPRKTPDARISYLLAQWLTNQPNQYKLCQEYLAIPTRKELLEDYNEVNFQHPRGDELFASAMDQFKHNVSTAVSPFKDFKSIDYQILLGFYHRKWREIMIGRNYRSRDGKVSRENIAGVLMTVP